MHAKLDTHLTASSAPMVDHRVCRPQRLSSTFQPRHPEPVWRRHKAVHYSVGHRLSLNLYPLILPKKAEQKLRLPHLAPHSQTGSYHLRNTPSRSADSTKPKGEPRYSRAGARRNRRPRKECLNKRVNDNLITFARSDGSARDNGP